MKNPSLRIAAAVLGFAASCAFAQLATEPERQPFAPEPAAVERPAPTRVHAVVLPPPPPELAKNALRNPGPGVPLQVGFVRSVPVSESREAFARPLAWETLGGGEQVAAMSVTSPGAQALRVGLQVESLPAGTVLRFRSPDGSEAYEVTAEEVRASLARDAAAGEASGLYWSPVVEAETLQLEVRVPPDAKMRNVSVAAPAISHLVTSSMSGFAMPKAAASCNLDATCEVSTWSNEENAVARIIFTKGGSSFVCTGTLLADRDASTTIPYFLTANHCIPDQASASTVQTYWFYRSASCDGGVRGPSQTRTGGATLLYASGATDTAFLRLNATPPAGVGYAGWQVGGTPARGTPVTGLHHPTGDLLKISHGTLGAYASCTPTGGDQFSCNDAAPASSTFYRVFWDRGTTEPGSSGSGVFLDNGRYLVGQLYGGDGVCGDVRSDFFGRFDVAYNAALRQWLGTTSAPTSPAVTPTQDYGAMWWNPAQSGWGLSLTQHGATIFGAWYVYDGAGRPTWVTLPGGQWISPTTYSGDLYASSGPDPLAGFFDPARVFRNKVGTATLAFSSASQGTVSWVVNGIGGSRAISRMDFGVPDATAVANFADLWWNASESGWGLSISQQYRTLFAVWYAYQGDGQPIWYVMSGGAWSGNTYTGTLYRADSTPASFFANGAFDPSRVTRTPVGSLSLQFTGSNSAVMRYTVNGVSGSKAITRLVF